MRGKIGLKTGFIRLSLCSSWAGLDSHTSSLTHLKKKNNFRSNQILFKRSSTQVPGQFKAILILNVSLKMVIKAVYLSFPALSNIEPLRCQGFSCQFRIDTNGCLPMDIENRLILRHGTIFHQLRLHTRNSSIGQFVHPVGEEKIG